MLTGNTRARTFYEAMGWNHDGTARDYLAWGIKIPEVRYRTVGQGRKDCGPHLAGSLTSKCQYRTRP